MDNKTAWIYDPFYFSRIVPRLVPNSGGGMTTSGDGLTVNGLPILPVFETEELHCAYCKRKHARGKETCAGCGAPL